MRTGDEQAPQDLAALLPFLPELLDGRPLCVLTGAGISAESGLPTFRGAGGMWEGSRAEDLATPGAFAKDPERVWRWYEWRRSLVTKARPNAGHLALARLERLLPQVTVVTQNVDGLHVAAGQKRVIEIHGSIRRTRCTREGTVEGAPDAPFPSLPPPCPGCGARLRPDVVWFGEPLPRGEWEAAEEAASESAVLLVVGTSSVVYPAAGLGLVAARAGSKVFEVNVDETPLSPLCEGAFRASASTVLPLVADAVSGLLAKGSGLRPQGSRSSGLDS